MGWSVGTDLGKKEAQQGADMKTIALVVPAGNLGRQHGSARVSLVQLFRTGQLCYVTQESAMEAVIQSVLTWASLRKTSAPCNNTDAWPSVLTEKPGGTTPLRVEKSRHYAKAAKHGRRCRLLHPDQLLAAAAAELAPS
jgi:hypothetical protein